MGDKTTPDSAEPRLESFYPPFVAGIDLPHQGVVYSYNLHNRNSYNGQMASFNVYIDGLVQERRNSIANALELHLSCTNPSIYIEMDPWLP